MSENQASLPTASDGLADFSFDGVFRELHSSECREKVTQAQNRMAANEWEAAERLLQEGLKMSKDPHDKRNLKLVITEVERYVANAILSSCRQADQIDWAGVLKRPVEQHVEKYTELPQSIFILRHESPRGVQFMVGRRLLSHQYRSGKIRELHCSLVTASMILGTLEDQRIRHDDVVLYYRPFKHDEKLALMSEMYKCDLATVELVFPFPVLKPDNHQELDCPPDGWEIDEPLAEQLGEGEVLLRQYSLKFLTSLKRDDLVLFDPACSTGQFLSTMRTAVPKAKTIGQDLSPFMVKYAKKRLDEIYCGDAKYPKIPAKTADVVFVRFINSEVVKSAAAMSILRPLANTVKLGGHMVIFGHTPVLMSAADLRSLSGWRLIQCVGGGPEFGGLFQYYVLRNEG